MQLATPSMLCDKLLSRVLLTSRHLKSFPCSRCPFSPFPLNPTSAPSVRLHFPSPSPSLCHRQSNLSFLQLLHLIYEMGLFGSARKKPHDQFQAAVEQQRRRGLANRLGGRQPEPSRLRHRWDNSPIVHPYGQPGFGFYSGENVAASSRQRQGGPRRSISFDEGLGEIPPQSRSEPLATGLLYPPHRAYSAPGSGYQRGGGASLQDLDLWAALRPPASPPYRGPEGQLLYPDHYFADAVPGTMVPPLSRTTTSSGALSRYPDQPIFDNFRPFPNSPGPNPYTNPVPNRDAMVRRYPAWNSCPGGIIIHPLSGMRAPGVPPRPPGSYERLRPPYLQLGNGQAGSGSSTRSSSYDSRLDW
jgi:hypothetical protein